MTIQANQGFGVSVFGAVSSGGGGGGGTPGGSSGQIQYNNSGAFGGLDLYYSSATLKLGAADVSTGAVAQTLQVQSNTGATTTGPNFTIKGSAGTTAGGSIIFQTHNGTAYATALTIASDKSATFENGRLNLKGTTVGLDGTGQVLTQFEFRTSAYILFGYGSAYAKGGATIGLSLAGSCSIGWEAGYSTQTPDLVILRDAANTLALRNSTNAQTFNIYNTYTDASNYERGAFKWTSNELTISTEKAGTGTSRSITLSSASNIFVDITGNLNIRLLGSGTTTAWRIEGTSGNLVCPTDNTYDIGASSGSRPRNVYVAGGGTFGSTLNTANIQVGNTSVIYWASYSAIRVPSDGVMTLTNNANTDWSRLQFGGTTSSFPALKRSTTTLQVRLADDSANAALESASVKTDAPSGGTSGTWKLGVRVAATTTLDTTQYIEVDVGGTLYKLAVVTS